MPSCAPADRARAAEAVAPAARRGRATALPSRRTASSRAQQRAQHHGRGGPARIRRACARPTGRTRWRWRCWCTPRCPPRGCTASTWRCTAACATCAWTRWWRRAPTRRPGHAVRNRSVLVVTQHQLEEQRIALAKVRTFYEAEAEEASACERRALAFAAFPRAAQAVRGTGSSGTYPIRGVGTGPLARLLTQPVTRGRP
jgi:hypothetical protein